MCMRAGKQVQMMLVLPFSQSVRKRREQGGGVLVVDHFISTHTLTHTHTGLLCKC